MRTENEILKEIQILDEKMDKLLRIDTPDMKSLLEYSDLKGRISTLYWVLEKKCALDKFGVLVLKRDNK